MERNSPLPITAENILNHYTSEPVGPAELKCELATGTIVRSYLKGALQERVQALAPSERKELSREIAVLVSDVMSPPSHCAANLKAYFWDLTAGERIALWNKIAGGLDVSSPDDMCVLKWTHAASCEALLAGFKMPVGECGIGVTPVMPDCIVDNTLKDEFVL